MTEEIKEILDKLKYIVDFSIIEHDTSFNSDNVEESVCLLISNECQLLLDYITNLQQENENGLKVNQNSHKYITELEMNNAILKEDLDKANDIITKDRQFYKCRMDEYVELKKENERLKEENKSYQEYPFIIIEKNGVICRKNQEVEQLNNKIKEQNLLLIEFQDMEQKLDIYKSRCEKATEELTYMSTDAYTDNYDIRDKHYNLLMNILNGSDEK